VTDRPISIRWISDVPSKMVKIVDYGAVSAPMGVPAVKRAWRIHPVALSARSPGGAGL